MKTYHYSDYCKKAVAADELTFDKITAKDKDLMKQVRRTHLKKNAPMIFFLLCAIAVCCWLIISCFLKVNDHIVVQIFMLGGPIVLLALCLYFLFVLIGRFKGFRRGVVLANERYGAEKDNRNKSYQYVFDIYMQDKDETLMSYAVDEEVFGSVAPGDGVVLVKVGKKVKVLGDPERKAVLDVSNIRSGI